MKKQLILIGAGGFARELIDWLRLIPESQRDWELTGYIDDRLASLEEWNIDLKRISTVQECKPNDSQYYVPAIGAPISKYRVCHMLEKRGAQFTSVFHPTAQICQRAQIGVGSVICAYATVGPDVKIGKYTAINSLSTIGHDAIIKDGCTLSAHCDVTGYAKLDRCVFLGSHAGVLPNVRVGEQAVIGAGSMAVFHVQPATTIFGVPPKVIEKRRIKELDNDQ